MTFVLAIAALGPAVAASGQTAAGPRVFGDAPVGPDGRQSLPNQLRSSGEIQRAGGPRDPRQPANLSMSFLPGVPDSALSTKLTYAKQENEFTADVAAALTAQHQSSTEDGLTASRSASGGFLWNMNSRTTLQFKASASVAPYLTLPSLAGVADTPANTAVTASPGQDSQYAALRSEVLSSDARAEIGRNFGRRVRVAASLESRRSVSADRLLDFGEESATAVVSGRLGRTAAVNFAYRYRTGSFGGPAEPTLRSHDVQIGVARTWQHSRRHATSVAIAAGPMDAGASNPFAVAGRVDLSHRVGAVWRATGSYRRDVEAIAGFGDAAFSDSVSAGVSRLLGRRMELDVTGAVSRGHIAAVNIDSSYHTYAASSRVRVALTRRLVLSAEYLLYRHRFGDGALLVDGFSRRRDSSGPRVGLALWIPIRVTGVAE